MSESLVFAVHGFLGNSADWSSIKRKLNHIDFQAIDLFKKESPEIKSFENYNLDLPPRRKKNIFIGYSLGGRLGLHLLSKNPAAFDHYVFLSTNPGLENESDKQLRLNADMAWAEQISAQNWDAFHKNWNNQSVFSRSVKPEPVRRKEDYDLNKLKESLIEWSLAKQKNMNDVIQKNQNKITWAVGSEDLKYCEMAENLKQKKILLDYKRIFSGHRILFDNPEAITELLFNLN